MTPARTMLIDTDTASDDAVALIMALRAPDVRVAAITTVAGNVRVDRATLNALYTIELCGADVPVYVGAAGPLLRPLRIADWFHGADGLGDHGFAPQRLKAQPGHAVDAIIQTVLANPGLDVVTLGPLTNLALALLREPKIVAAIGRLIVMGGAACCEGNVTPAAEFNIWVDPDAARIVFRAGLPIEMVGWELSRGAAVLNAADINAILTLKTPLADYAIRCNSRAAEAFHEQTGETGIALPDPIAMAVAIDSSLCVESSLHAVDIETTSELTRGMTVVDRLGVSGTDDNRAQWSAFAGQAPRTRVCWRIDVPGWKALLMRSLSH